ncbi:extracellular solute-binding protein [Halococcus sp. AFM35]|uniref:extracellular solute-binding protein n=1 Tax=Halococcus sp. AFM35 TaxID=3421653 RepID=UPI003EBA8810
MREQRRRPTGRSRRAFLQAAGAAGLVGLTGCVGSGAERGGNDGTARDAPVSILAAGSLQNALSNGLEPAVDVPIQVETHGSATVARLIDEGKRDPDIVSVADVALFEKPLSPPWHAVFTSNAVVIAYNPDTKGGKRLAEAGAREWYKTMASDDVRIGRTDPDRDPLGYRTLFTLELASRYYDDASNLRRKLLKQDQIYPETALISRFESGSIDAAIAYRNMAVERDYDYIDLPDEVDLSNPEHEDEWYSTVSYSLPGGQTVHGGPISYGSTIRKTSDAARNVFAAHTTGDYLDEYGFLLRERFPTYEGDVPQRVKRATVQSGGNRPAGAQSMLGSAPGEPSSVVSGGRS